MPSLNPELTAIPIESLRGRTSAKWARYPADVLPAWVAEMDFPLALPVRTSLVEAVERGDCGYSWPEGLELAEAFAAFAEDRMGWDVDPAGVHPAPDVVAAIRAVLGEIARPGDPVVINTPVYHPFFAVIEEAGCDLVEAPLAKGRLDPEAIERCFTEGAVALILCSPHNPTGGVPSREELVTIAAAAARHGAWVLADEIHAPLTLPDGAHTPFLTVSEEAQAHGIAFCSASKAFNIAGLGCAQMITASDRAADVIAGLPHGATHCDQLGAIASVAAFRDGGPWLDDVLAVLEFNRRLLSELLDQHLPDAGYREPGAGYLAWLDLRKLGLGDDPSEQLLESGRVALSPGPVFGPQGTGFARLNFGTSPALLEEIVERMARGAAGCRGNASSQEAG